MLAEVDLAAGVLVSMSGRGPLTSRLAVAQRHVQPGRLMTVVGQRSWTAARLERLWWAGTVIGELRHRRRSVAFRTFRDTIDAHNPPELDLHLILDHSSIHKSPLIHRCLFRHPRVHLHFTPTSPSWLTLVECWFARPTTRRLARAAFRSTWALEQVIKSCIATTNAEAKPFVWTRTADEILESGAR